MPAAVPVSPSVLVERLAERIIALVPGQRLRIAVDGPPPADPGNLADALVDPLRVGGRPVLRVRADDFLRPASLRLEQGRRNPDSYYDGWWDLAALRREVLDPGGPDGTGRVLPRLWDAATDRATRDEYVSVPPGGVVILSGTLLLGVGLPFEYTVHLALSPATLARRTTVDQRWTLPAFTRYVQEVDPAALADVVVRVDDPRRPAVLW